MPYNLDSGEPLWSPAHDVNLNTTFNDGIGITIPKAKNWKSHYNEDEFKLSAKGNCTPEAVEVVATGVSGFETPTDSSAGSKESSKAGKLAVASGSNCG